MQNKLNYDLISLSKIIFFICRDKDDDLVYEIHRQ